MLSIAGFDPTGGAGLLSDIKTFESNAAYGLGACSAITVQTDVVFDKVIWTRFEDILDQVKILQDRFSIEWVKFGLIENFEAMISIVDHMLNSYPNTKIIWDPIISASSGYIFHEQIDINQIEQLCKKIFLITPNFKEIQQLTGESEAKKAATTLSTHCNVLLKGGHSPGSNADDVLYSQSTETRFTSKKLIGQDKHGTGCVLSAAILANLANQDDLTLACKKAKMYIDKYLISNRQLLGYHTTES